ncbi:MAG: V-type ATPase subunit [Thermoproteota archaeon]
MKTGEYAYLEVRLTSLDAKIHAVENKSEARSIFYLELLNLIDFLPEGEKTFVEWWIMRNDFENIKDAAAQIFGGIRYGFSRPFLKIRREEILHIVESGNVYGLLDFLPNTFEGFKNYCEFAFKVDMLYFQGFQDRFLKKPDEELTKKLVWMKIDLLNLRMLQRVDDLKRFFLPYGLLTVDDLKNNSKLPEKLFELYGVKSVEELEKHYYSFCANYDSGFAKIMGFIISYERFLEGGEWR